MPSKKPCLLIVDDEPDLVQSIKDLLRFDYKVLGATRAAEGLNIVEREEVHVVMSDQRMPEMSGVEFLGALRQSHPDIVRLLITAYSDIDAVTDAINQGNVYRYISKPWQPSDLRVTLKQAVEHFELQAERRRLLVEVQEKNRQLEAANDELRRANDLKRAFIKVASHELRTPLAILLGLGELACRGEDAPKRGTLEQMHAAGQRLGERVEQMVKLLHADRFERTLHLHEVPIGELVRHAVQMVQHFSVERRQNLEIDVPEGLGTLRLDVEKVHDAVVQILMNAIKFTPNEGTVRVSARRNEANEIEIQITDSGMGIDANALNRIFEPFFTGHDVSRHSSGTFEFGRRGLGLGLAVVKTFVDMHDGRIRVSSEVGKGSQFTLVLPPTTETAP